MMLVTPERIASVMSIAATPHSFAELDALVAHGLPKAALRASVEHFFIGTEDRKKLMHRIIPEATYKRRTSTLSQEESAKTERLARIFATAHYVWDSEDEARAFMTSPHSMLQGVTPLDVSMTELGARRVEELLWRLFYGIPA